MKRIALKTNCALAFMIAGILAVGQAGAEKPSWAGEGKGGKSGHPQKSAHEAGRQEKGEDRSQRGSERGDSRVREHFDARHRTIAHDYYSDEFRHGRCPPGLAKKHNGCMPPGQARKWTVGRQLPREVIFYDLPPALIAHFGRPPTGQRYVRVDSDILLITIGTGMVIDALQNLGAL